MPVLEEGFGRLYFPPLVREVIITKEYPGYRYDYFRTFRELDIFFSELCGSDWRKQDWALFWFGQHEETKHDDRNEGQIKQHRGPRRDSKAIYEMCKKVVASNPKISSMNLQRALLKSDISINQSTAWRLLQKIKQELGNG